MGVDHPPAARLASTLANVLELGKTSLPLRQFLVTVAAGCRHLSVEQSGDFMKVAVAVPGLRHVVMPPGLTFARLDDTGLLALQGFVKDCKPARLLAVHDAPHAALARQLLPAFAPDVLVWPLDTAPPAGFAALPPPAHAARLGLAAHALLCRPRFGALRHALIVQADAAWRRAASRPSRVLEISELVLVEGCWPIERDRFSSWAWTGTQRLATLLLPPAPAGRLRVTMFFYATKIPIEPSTLRLFVNGRTGIARHFADEMKLETDIVNDDDNANALILRLQHGRLGTSDDGSRSLGVALHKIKYELLP
jgi:hypothetical protein